MIRRKDLYKNFKKITHTTEVRVRFNETDPLGIVWHGNYITYFEDGREGFGREYGISYLDIQQNNLVTPIVKSSCEHKLTVKYGDVLRVETTYIDTPAAKLIYVFKIYNQNNELVCLGETTQVFLNQDGELLLNVPPFIENWKKKMNL